MMKNQFGAGGHKLTCKGLWLNGKRWKKTILENDVITEEIVIKISR